MGWASRLSVSSLTSFANDIIFICKFWTFLVKFTPPYWVSWCCMTWNNFLTFFFRIVVYMETWLVFIVCFFCTLKFHQTNKQQLVSLEVFLESSRFSTNRTLSSTNRDDLMASIFLTIICYLFIVLSCSGWYFRTMLSRGSERELGYLMCGFHCWGALLLYPVCQAFL